MSAGYRGRELARDYNGNKSIKEKRQASRETLETVKSFRLIEHSIILNPNILKMLKEIAFERGNALNYSETVAFLVNYYYKSQNKDRTFFTAHQ